MKIEEPKTPYNYTDPNDEDAPDELDAKLLAEKYELFNIPNIYGFI